jgi:type I restriction enzyme S subunit
VNERSVRLKFLLDSIEQGWSPECDNVTAQDGEWGVLKTGCVNGAVFNPGENKRLPAIVDPIPEYEVRPGDVLMSRANTTELVGSAAYVRETPPRLLLCDKLYRLTAKPRVVQPRFLAWFLASATARSQLEPEATGTSGSMQNIGQDTVRDLWMPMLAYSQQVGVADYLDLETARLDALVAAKGRVLGLLAEKRRALITRAVTRGLDPRAPLRDSGIPWLGEIPAHWGAQRVAWLFRERDERGEPDLPLLEVSINAGVVLREFSTDRIESTAADFNTYKVARTGDVVFNKMRMWQGAVGVVPQDGLVSPDYTVAAPSGPLSPEYGGCLFRTERFSAECARRSHGIVWDRLRLYWDGFRSIEVPLPSQHEQAAIVAYIATATAKLDALRVATEQTIALLKERRAALIAAAVTGRIDVGAAAA